MDAMKSEIDKLREDIVRLEKRIELMERILYRNKRIYNGYHATKCRAIRPEQNLPAIMAKGSEESKEPLTAPGTEAKPAVQEAEDHVDAVEVDVPVLSSGQSATKPVQMYRSDIARVEGITRVHKHSDDLSICLYSKGHNIFVDPGMYSYSYGDRRRLYMESLPAHSTICIKDRPYQIGSGNGWAFKFQKRQHHSEYDYAMVSSRGYADTAIYRHLYYLRQMDVIVIYDECISKTPQTFAQYFHLGHDILPGPADPQQIDLVIPDTSCIAAVRQLLPVDKARLLNGENTTPMSLISSAFGKCIDSYTLEYTKNGTVVSFVTTVDIHRRGNECCRSTLEDSTLTVEKSGQTVELKLTQTVPVSIDGVTAALQMSGMLAICNKSAAVSKQTVYVFDEETGDVQKYPYTREREFTVDLRDMDYAVLVYFAANDTNETLKCILGEWKNGVYFPFEHPILPFNCKMSLEQESESGYAVRIAVPDMIHVSVSWWIYRNGALYSYEANNELEFHATFTESGEYVIICSLKNKYFGEFFFQQSNLIVIP